LSGLAPKLLAARPGRDKTGFDAFTEQVAFELGNSCQHGRHHPAMRRVQLECHATHGNDRNLPASQLVQRVQQVLSGAALPGQLADKDGIYLPCLSQIENSVPGGTIGGCTRGRFFEDTDHFITTAFSKSCQFHHLSVTRLIGSGNPSIDGCALSQLNPLRNWSCKPLILLVRDASRTGI